MKPLPLLLAVSLAANAALLVWVTRERARADSARSLAAPAAHATATTQPSTDLDAAATALNWPESASTELRTLPARLRAAGFPPHLVKAIVAAEIAERFRPRRLELLAAHPPPEYWQSGRFQPFDGKYFAAERDLRREQQALERELLGPAATRDEIFVEFQRRRFGDLPVETLDELFRISSDYQDLRSEVFAATNGIQLPEDREKLAFLEKEERADFAALMSPAQLLEYELRSSSTANTLRSQLAGVQPTEAEFRQLYSAFRDIENRLEPSSSGMMTPDRMREVRTALLAALEGQMPAERLALVDQSFDPTYAMSNRLVARLGLPPSAARDVVTVQQDITTRANALRSNRELSAADRATQLSALEQEANRRLQATLGDRGAEAYRQFGGGWLRTLQPPPPPPPRPGS